MSPYTSSVVVVSRLLFVVAVVVVFIVVVFVIFIVVAFVVLFIVVAVVILIVVAVFIFVVVVIFIVVVVETNQNFSFSQNGFHSQRHQARQPSARRQGETIQYNTITNIFIAALTP